LLPQGRPRSCELTLNEPLRHLFASSMSLVALWWMLVISDGAFSPRNNWRLKSYLRHEEPYMKPLPRHITRPWCGARITFLTLSYHQQQPTGGRERDRLVPVPTRDPPAPATVTYLIKCGCKKISCTSHCSYQSQPHRASTAPRCVCVEPSR